MAKKYNYLDTLEIEKYNEEKPIEPVSAKNKKDGVIIRIIKGKSILIRYGDNLGAKVPYVENKHRDLREGDPISFF